MQRRRRRRQPCAVRLREYFRQFVAFMFSNVGVIGLVVAYIIAGAFIFQAIEGSSEIERVQGMARARKQAAERLWRHAALPLNVFDETLWKYNVSSELKNYQSIVVRAVRKGWDGSDDEQLNRQWSFPGAFLYSLTVITTIGYGNISPRTDWGKVTTIFYAIIGMPLFLLYLTNIGDILARSFKWFYVYVCLCRGCPGIAKRRATRLRMQIQAQLGEPPDPVEPSMRLDRGGSAPERIPRQNCSEHLEMLPCSGPVDEYRYPQVNRRGESDPCSSRRYDLELRRIPGEHIDSSYNYHRPDRFYESSCRLAETYDLDDHSDSYQEHIDHYEERQLQNRHYMTETEHFHHKKQKVEDINENFRRHRYNDVDNFYDPADDYGEVEDDNYGKVERRIEPTDSDEFTYITIDSQNIAVPITICVFIMVGYIIFGAMLFGMWEDWDRVDGSYFCFISLTSIGFGDIVPGERIYARVTHDQSLSLKNLDTSFILCSMYLLFGMALIAMCFNLMQEQVIQYMSAMKRVVKRICRFKR